MQQSKNPIIVCALLLVSSTWAQSIQITPTAEQIIALTPQWKGERLADGRPKASDRLLERLKNVSTEDTWGGLRGAGYNNQFEGEWLMLHPDQVMVGRAVTAQYMPLRPDWFELIKAKGAAEGRIGGSNAWPIEALSNGDIYVADGFGKIVDGTLMGDSLGNSIYAHSKNGVIFYGAVRDMEGLSRIGGFNAWIKGYDPSTFREMMLTSINMPIRIGRASVLPGDVVLARKGGVYFIPPHLLEEVVAKAEYLALKDAFGHQRLREGRYTAGEIDERQWSDALKKDFLGWLDRAKLPMTRAELDAFMKSHPSL